MHDPTIPDTVHVYLREWSRERREGEREAGAREGRREGERKEGERK